MGVIVPSALGAILFLLPRVDKNPSRRACDRRLALYLGLLLCASIVFLTWMDTPDYGVRLPLAEEVLQTVMPEEGIGPVRDLSWEAPTPGEWDTRTVDMSTARAELRRTMARIADLIADEHARATALGEQGLPNGYARLAIEQWQPGVRKATLIPAQLHRKHCGHWPAGEPGLLRFGNASVSDKVGGVLRAAEIRGSASFVLNWDPAANAGGDAG
jgi:hypothetical protein